MAGVTEFNEAGQERYVIQAFKGIDDHERIADGSWQEMLNLSAEEYPAAMARRTRKRAKYYTTWEIKRCMLEGSGTQDGFHLDMVLTLEPGITPPNAPFEVKVMGRTYTVDAVENASVGSQDAKALVIGDYSKAYDIAVELRKGRVDALYNGGTVMPMGLGEPVDAAVIDDMIVTAYERGQIAYGDKVKLTDATVRRIACIGRMVYTDKGALLNTGTDEMTNTHQLVRYDGGSYTVQMVDAGGASITVAQTEPNPPSDGDYWYDSVRDGLYQWSDGQQEWIAIATRYLKLTLPNTADLSGFSAGDVVEATIERYKSAYVVHSVDNANHVIVLRGLLYQTPQTPTMGVIIERKMPVLDYICEHDNRIWGCRYGMNGEGADAEFVNEVYCCALGDPMNWFLYEGTAADSWTASVGAPGKWTGIKECGEYLVFFKEDRYYILSGSAPSNYRLTEFEADGVMDGCDRSIQNIGGSLYYKSVHGIRRLTPYGYPQDVSEALNTDKWTDAIAGTDDRRYYIQMARGNEKDLYVLDTETGFWTREDAPENMYLMIRYMNELTAVCATEGTVFAYAGYDADAAEAAEPMKGDYDNIPSYVAAHLAWDTLKLESIAFAAMSVTRQCLEYEVTTPAAIKAKVDDLNENGYFLKYKYFWNIDYILLSSAGRNKTPCGFVYDENSFNATALEGEWIEDAAAEWYGVTGLMGLGLPDEKRVRVIQMRIKTEAKTRMKVKVQTDESGKWTEVWSANTGRSGTHRIAYTPAGRNDTFRFKLEGAGPMVLYSITYQLEQGGDMNVPEHTKT